MKKRFNLLFHILFCLIPGLLLSCSQESATVAVTGLSVQPASLTMTEGETAVLSATVHPDNATDKTVLWSSSDQGVATVSDGTVSALKAGVAEICALTGEGSFKAVCTVSVQRAPALVVDPGQNLKPVFDHQGGTASVSFRTTGPWTATFLGESGNEWIELKPDRGDAGSVSLRLTVTENTGFEGRNASIRIQCEDDSETIAVSQKQKDDLTVSSSLFEVDNQGGTIEIEVKSNIDYAYRIEGDWIRAAGTRLYQSRTLSFVIAPNETVTKREGAVVFSGNGLTETVRIFQEGEEPTILLSQDVFNFDSEGGSFMVFVRSNVDVAVEIPTDVTWIKDITTRTISSHQFTFEVSTNPECEERSAEILFTNRDNGLTETLRVFQEGEKPAIQISQNEFDFNSDGGSFSVVFGSNVDVDVEIPTEVTWIKNITTRTFSSHQFDFEVLPNPGYEERSARILFTNRDNGLTETVTVRQAQKDVILLSDNEIVLSENGGEFEVGVFSNIEYSVLIEDDWIREAPRTRGLSDSTLRFTADPLPEDQFFRQGRIVFTGSGQSLAITVIQKETSPIIRFQDSAVKAICVQSWDRNGDGELSEREAATVKNLSQARFRDSGIRSFDELALFTGIETLPYACFANCSLLSSVALPDGLKSIEAFAFNDCTALSRVPDLPESLEELGYGAFMSCTGLKGELTLPEAVRSIGRYAFMDADLSRINVRGRVPFECNYAFDYTDCLIYVPSGMAKTFQEAEYWTRYRGRITEEGHDPADFFYASTDYSRDGEVICLQKATKGKGIEIVFMGDGYVDKDMEPGGKYETVMGRWMEQFFVYEPYKTLRDWFTIYLVKVVSKHDVFNCPYAERRLTRDDGNGINGNTISALLNTVDEYVLKVSDDTPKVAVFMNTDATLGRSFCNFGSDGSFSAWIFESIDRRPTALNHEAGGHGMGWLGDEYTQYEINYNAQSRLESYYRWGKWGAFRNLYWKNDPETVPWSRFLNDSRYAGEGLGIFEGGLGYAYGVFRPTMNSMMRFDSDPGAVFNAPSREAIYKNIMLWGNGEDWEYDYETFVAVDEAGRKQAAEAYSAYPPTRSSLVQRDDFLPGLPPIRIDESVREIRISKDGKITLIR